MSLLKVSVLSVSGLALWLAPPFIFSRKIPLHNFMQGIALVSGFACCFEARRSALKVAKEEEFEAMKARAIDADVADELSTSIYVAEQQRRKEAEEILNPVEHLERALALTSDDDEHSDSDQLAEPSANAENERAERILELKAKGWGKLKIINEIWGLTRGGGAKYKAAEAEYHRVVGE
ncbi:hypothetical protein [Microcoleus asticus]|uniref:Uncharacterized protein n=1 Tax=Microcoleus asticus IPMA8 TaxID=2563858 RepID=A0ABX2D6K9_9CYAN|nr:hypothetical protein [Microcoleus asticus]NQE38198.1 hypothetical protein [Microcoleus asticus IPMA8]